MKLILSTQVSEKEMETEKVDSIQQSKVLPDSLELSLSLGALGTLRETDVRMGTIFGGW